MADRFYGIDRGANAFADVVDGSSSPTKDVEIVIDLAVSLERSEVLQLIDILKDRILADTWPPA